MRLLALCALAAAGCGVLDFDLTRPLPPQEIMGNPALATAGALLPETGVLPSPFALDVDLASEQKARDTGPIDSVHLKSLTLQIAEGSGTQDFDWLLELHVFVESIQPVTNLPRVEIARLVMVPGGQKTVSLEVSPDVNLLPYINEGTKTSTRGKARVPSRDVSFSGQMVLRVSPL
jgi:hypothetical protein